MKLSVISFSTACRNSALKPNHSTDLAAGPKECPAAWQRKPGKGTSSDEHLSFAGDNRNCEGRFAMTSRQRLPDRRGAVRLSIRHDGATYLITADYYSNGALAEIFIDAPKPGSALAVHMSDAAVLASLLLQHGVSAAEIRHSISGPLSTALDILDGGQS
jgi:hypothetical protein